MNNAPQFSSRQLSVRYSGPLGKHGDGYLDIDQSILHSSEAPSYDPVQVLKESKQRDKLRRECDKARLRGQLLQAKLDAARQELKVFRGLLEKQRVHHKHEIKALITTHVPQNKRICSMASLLASSHRATARNQEERLNERVGDYNIEAFLGKGAYGNVFSGIHCKTKKEYAIKVFNKDATRSRRQMMDVEHEVAVMKYAEHPNIVSLQEVVHSRNHICMVMELGYTDLYSWAEYHRNNGNDMSHRVYREIILGIVKPIKHLHAIGIAHLDVKDDNILVTKDVSVDELTQEHIKLCDFGLCVISSSADGSIGESSLVGTTGYFAPEMTRDDDYDARAADMFSVGCTLLNLIDRVPKEWMEVYALYKTSKDNFQKRMRVLTMVLHCDDALFQGVYPPIIEIIRSLLKSEPEKRLTAAQVLQHPWLVEK